MRISTVPAIFVLAALTTLGACKCAPSESPLGSTVGTSSEPPVALAASPAPPVPAAPTAVAEGEPACSPWCNQPGKDDSGCQAEVTHLGIKGEIVGSWKEILTRLQATAPGGASPWDKLKPGASEAEIRQALTGKPDRAGSMWLIPAGVSLDEPSVWHVVGKRSDGKLALFLAVATPSEHNATCPMHAEAAIETNGMPRLIINEVLFTPAPAEMRYGCEVGSYARRTIFLDPSKPDIPLLVEEKASAENDAKPAWTKIVQQKDQVKVTGGECDLEEPLRL
jgi:hypothetical protein